MSAGTGLEFGSVGVGECGCGCGELKSGRASREEMAKGGEERNDSDELGKAWEKSSGILGKMRVKEQGCM